MTGPDRIVPLYSSSSGNATLIKSRGTYILVDCGMSCKMMTKALVESGVYPDDVSAIFLTHRHTDHIGGVAVFSRKYHTPIYGTPATYLDLPIPKPTEQTLIMNVLGLLIA